MTQTLEKQRYARRLGTRRVNKDLALWNLGNPELLRMPLASVIGTRQPSDQGIARTRRITKLLVEQGFGIVSGLAKGIDTVAHETALELGGSTIAVMGTPIDECYPASNAHLKERITKEGLVLSQFAPGDKVFRSNFPKRNTLMAALCDITIVTEAGEKSGARHQVSASVRLGQPVGFLASTGEIGFPWVAETLDSGYGFVINESVDLLEHLESIRKKLDAESSPQQMEEQLKLPNMSSEVKELGFSDTQGHFESAPDGEQTEPIIQPGRVGDESSEQSQLLRMFGIVVDWGRRKLSPFISRI